GPGAGEHGGRILYSGPPDGLTRIAESRTAAYLFGAAGRPAPRTPRRADAWLELRNVTRNNIRGLDVRFPLRSFTAVTGISGSGKSSLVSQVLVELLAARLGQTIDEPSENEDEAALLAKPAAPIGGALAGAVERIGRLVQVDQRPIGRTPRSNLATYTGLFDPVRRLFARTRIAKARRYDAGRFSFNVSKGRCETCQGEGFVSVELLFLPSVYTPCPTCHGARYNAKTLEVKYRDRSIADVLAMTVDDAAAFFSDEPSVLRPLEVLRQVGLGYLRLGQPATELSGGEAQRIKLATELHRISRGDTLYVLDEPTTGLHPSDVEKLLAQLHGLVDRGNTVIVVEHDMLVIAASDWVIDIGPGAGADGGRVVVAGPPLDVARAGKGRTAPYLAAHLRRASSPSRPEPTRRQALPPHAAPE
ncbi:MAG TPA: excinuclease ABC subunit A, partial [Polyangia bacterium]|nr:excinuclease ABC subunit A [Polyangia bacterium]